MFGDGESAAAARLIAWAIEEDLGSRGDVTSQSLLPVGQQGAAVIVCRAEGVLAGLPIVQQIITQVAAPLKVRTFVADGARVQRGTVVAELTGDVLSLLALERTMLNFLTHLSGIATLTRAYVDAVRERARALVLDTRKTLPGWRLLQKYAVRCGGGANHRLGLWDAVLIKDNHLAAVTAVDGRSPADVVRAVRRTIPPGMLLEIEVDSLEQLSSALAGAPDMVLLDNMPPLLLREAVAVRDRLAKDVLLEASGGVDLQSVGAIAATGVDRISVGRLTHSAPALDLAFDWGRA
jgi:nicotinate-nucleotide pyrophosphorylase (carboxylating)